MFRWFGRRRRVRESTRPGLDRARYGDLFDLADATDADLVDRQAGAWQGVVAAQSVGDDYAEALFTGMFVMLDREAGDSSHAAQRRRLDLQRRAVELAERPDDVGLEIRLKSNLAGLLMEASLPDPVGRLTEGIGLLDEIIAVATAQGDTAVVSHHKSNRSLAVARLRRFSADAAFSIEEALADADSAVRARQDSGSPGDLAYSLMHRGVIQLDLAMSASDAARALGAVDDFTAAVNLADSIADVPLLTACLTDLAVAEVRAAMLRDDPPDGPLWPSAYRHAGRIADDVTATASIRGRANATMAEALTRMDPDHSEITPRLSRAVELLTVVDDPLRLCETAAALGDRLASDGLWVEAGARFEQAMEADDFLADFGAASDRPAAVTERSVGPVGRWAAYCFAKAGDYRRAVEILDASRCRHVGRTRRAEEVDLGDVADALPELAQRFVEAREVLRSEILEDSRPELRQELLSAIRAIREAGFPRFLLREPFDAIARDFTAQHPLVYLLAAPPGCVALIVSGEYSDGVLPVWADGVTSTDLARLTVGGESSLVFAESAADYKTVLDRVLPVLGDELMGPFARELRLAGAQRVTLISTGMLAWWPLHAASFISTSPTGEEVEECLWSLMPVAYLPAAPYHLDQETLEQRRGLVRVLIGLADPIGEWAPLPGSRLELRSVFHVYPGDAHVVFGAAATGRFLLQHLGRPVDIHLGCHAIGSSAGQGGAVLLLSDGELAFADLDRLGGQRPIGLVVAAACASGTSDLAVPSDESMNLATGFLNAGATGVVTALWPIADLPTSLLLRQFAVNTEIARMDHAEALRAAALWLRALKSTEVPQLAEQFGAGVEAEAGLRDAAVQPTVSRRARGRSGPGLPYSHPFHWAGLIYTGSMSSV